MNVVRRNEPVATDTIWADVPAVDNGALGAQFFCGTQTLFCDVFEVRTDADSVHTLEDVIRKRGAMDVLVSDRARAEISKAVKRILRHLCIDDWQSKPQYHHQNPAEQCYRWVKESCNRVMNTTGAPDYTWLLALQYVCFVGNRTAKESLKWRTPFEALSGSTPDISAILRFKFWEPVFVKYEDSHGGNIFHPGLTKFTVASKVFLNPWAMP